MVLDVPWELVEAIADQCDRKALVRLALVSRAFQALAEKRLYESVIISEVNQVDKSDYRLLQTLASSPSRAGYVHFFLVEFGSYRDQELEAEGDDWHFALFTDVFKMVKRELGINEDKDDVKDDVTVPRAKPARTWDATKLALKALGSMHFLTDLRVKVRKGASRLTPKLNRIVSARLFKLKVLFCDSRLDLKALVEAHQPTLEVLVVWMWSGYNSTADLIPYMQPASNGTLPHPTLIVAGFEPTDNPSRSEDAIMVFPKYLSVVSEEEGVQNRTLDEALGVLKQVFYRDTRREGIRLDNMTTVICCVESLSGAGVDTAFTQSIARQCKLVKEFVIYYDKFGGLLSTTLARSLSSFRKLEVLYVHAWHPEKVGSKWKKVPKAKVIEFASKCGEACQTLRGVQLIKGPNVDKKNSQWVVRAERQLPF